MTIATFSNAKTDKNFIYYCPNNLVYHKIQGNEIQGINIFISDKQHEKLTLIDCIPTIVKLILKKESDMYCTSNLRLSNQAL